jgi:hypothetical protein
MTHGKPTMVPGWHPQKMLRAVDPSRRLLPDPRIPGTVPATIERCSQGWRSPRFGESETLQ